MAFLRWILLWAEWIKGRKSGRSTRIRTLDPLLPKQVRYQAALHSDGIDILHSIGPTRHFLYHLVL